MAITDESHFLQPSKPPYQASNLLGGHPTEADGGELAISVGEGRGAGIHPPLTLVAEVRNKPRIWFQT
jgi:hypothetical protein